MSDSGTRSDKLPGQGWEECPEGEREMAFRLDKTHPWRYFKRVSRDNPRSTADCATGGAWSDPEVDCTGLLPDDALLAAAVVYASAGAADLSLPHWEHVRYRFGHGEKWARLMCKRFGIDPETGEYIEDRSKYSATKKVTT